MINSIMGMVLSLIDIWGVFLVLSLSFWSIGEISIGFFIGILILKMIRINMKRRRKKAKKYYKNIYGENVKNHYDLYEYHKILSTKYYNHFR